jgi:uncharacterized membrane protein YdjX (TVP38/TMEM64 family)
MALALRAIGLENAQQFIRQFGAFGPIVFVVLSSVSLILAPLSGSSLFVIGGLLFGKGFALGLSWIASVLGCSANFWISRRFGRSVASRFVGQAELDKLDKFISQLKSHHSILYIILIMPLSQDVVSYAVGLTPIKYLHFLVALMISSLVIVGAYIYLGSGLLELLI